MSLKTYIQEDGSGNFRGYLVADLIPTPSTDVEILILLESPHRDELAQRVPISGRAGIDALRYLKHPTTGPHALGPFVSALHAKHDGRIAIMNVSEVPLQQQAFAGHPSVPSLTNADWALLALVRSRKAQGVARIQDAAVRRASDLLLSGFRVRFDALRLSAGVTVVPAGNFARWFLNSLTPARSLKMLPIPHPSRGLWDRASGQNLQNLMKLKALFDLHTP